MVWRLGDQVGDCWVSLGLGSSERQMPRWNEISWRFFILEMLVKVKDREQK